ncbi:MAG TPA: DUF4105 domain-containing protein [Deltaproteobacteria bacterium]|nr:DUF4105 domain-containing protein [Deltaproteobacteria bacterium]HXK48484.1 DUF4105 domain-containing protein [Deltaproteobacteria bacterium]
MRRDSGRGCWVKHSRTSSLCIGIFLSAFLIPTVHAQDAPYLARILESVRQQRLHEDPYWHVLVHYRKTCSGVESVIDDPKFFLATDGKTNPEAELEATVRAFFDPVDDENDSAVCRFAARYEWIKERTGLDPGRLPVPQCRSFLEFMDRIRPESVTLVFPMAHLNSPASMYGHTLLAVGTANGSKLLAYSVSYSAFTRETFGPSFAVKSMVGLYPGYFSVLPYYAKLQEYSDVDHRDIWEYRLNLTEPEIRRMMLHIRELDMIASDYYFFDENCSYLLFFLLEAARPGVRLSDRVHGWLIPLDSIRMIEDQGMVTGAFYRPSRTTKIKWLASGLSDALQEKALGLAAGDAREDPFESGETTDQEKIRTYDLGSEYLQYLYTRGEVPAETYQARLMKILQARSRLGVSEGDIAGQVPVPAEPTAGHHSNRFAVGAGFHGDEVFEEIRIRPAYHHLMDNDDGYIRGAQLIFADAALRYYSSDRKLVVEELDLIDITSLTPRDRFFHPVSWKIRTGFTRIRGEDLRGHPVYQVNPGGGIALDTGSAGLAYVMFETGLLIGGVLENDYAVGAGGSAGFMQSITGMWKVHCSVRDLYYGPWDGFNDLEAALRQSFFLGPDRSISVDVARRLMRGYYRTEAKVLWNLFF